MLDVSNRLFLCYAWEDKARIQKLALEIEHEIQAKISTGLLEDNATQADDSVYQKIADAEIFIVFISDAAKKSDYVRTCVSRASHLNKNILPVEIDKQGIFSAKNPEEFKFRSKTYAFTDELSKSGFFAQLKASLGFNVEGGDGFGAVVHVVTDRNAHIKRYGTIIGYAEPNIDSRIRLAKGTHLLQIVDAEDPSLFINQTIMIDSNDAEKFINIPMEQKLKEKLEHEEKEKFQKEARERFEREQYELKLRREAELREEEERRKREEEARLQAERERMALEAERQRLKAQQAQINQARQSASSSSNDSNEGGCVESIIGWIVIIVIGIIIFSIF